MRPDERASRATAGGWAGAIAILATVGIAAYLVVRLRNTDVALHFYVVTMAVCGSVVLADRALRGLRFEDGLPLIARLRRRSRRIQFSKQSTRISILSSASRKEFQ